VRAELFATVGADLGEGPQLFPDGILRWVDLVRGNIYRVDNDTTRLEGSLPYEVSKVLPWHRGELALTRIGVETLDETAQTRLSIPLTSPEGNARCSDGTVLPDGSIALGIVDRELRPGMGSLITISHDCSVKEIVSDCTIPNGIATLASGHTVAWTDSPTHALTLLDWSNSAGLNSPRPWVTISDSRGVPDGLVADSSGGVWVAMWGGGVVLHISEEGVIDDTIEVGTPYTTSVAFDAQNNLLITTGSIVFREEGLPVPPGAGDVWIVSASEHGTQGLPPVTALLSILDEEAVASESSIPSKSTTSYSEPREDDS
jgi:sugar lactone lactonase YvrE